MKTRSITHSSLIKVSTICAITYRAAIMDKVIENVLVVAGAIAIVYAFLS